MTPQTKILLMIGIVLVAGLLAFGLEEALHWRSGHYCPPANPNCGRLPPLAPN